MGIVKLYEEFISEGKSKDYSSFKDIKDAFSWIKKGNTIKYKKWEIENSVGWGISAFPNDYDGAPDGNRESISVGKVKETSLKQVIDDIDDHEENN